MRLEIRQAPAVLQPATSQIGNTRSSTTNNHVHAIGTVQNTEITLWCVISRSFIWPGTCLGTSTFLIKAVVSAMSQNLSRSSIPVHRFDLILILTTCDIESTSFSEHAKLYPRLWALLTFVERTRVLHEKIREAQTLDIYSSTQMSEDRCLICRVCHSPRHLLREPPCQQGPQTCCCTRG
jgi:hypothetical protein